MLIKDFYSLKKFKWVWNKTINLKKLKDFNFLVPDFIAIPNNFVELINKDKNIFDSLIKNIFTEFSYEKYAVRSSSILEDQENSSFAWQFHTEINISKKDLKSAIKILIDDAINKNSLNNFSIIIQKYIKADYFWVCFTRNPNWNREMIIEYHNWIWEDLVSGKINPIKEVFYCNEDKKILWFDTEIFKDIEKKFLFPQDIEWCIKDWKMYILQTRHITTISKQKYEQIIFLEKELFWKEKYFYEKTEISEVASRPTPFTFWLLEKIYANNWPIKNVYNKFWIKYFYTNFLVVFWNELFIDKNLELKSLLPSFDLLNDSYKIKIKSIKNIFVSIKNIFNIFLLKEDKDLINKIRLKLNSNFKTDNFNEWLSNFLKDYEIIFEINILSAKYIKKAEILIKKENISITSILQSDINIFGKVENSFDFLKSPDNLIWNTLEIYDSDDFFTTLWKINNSDEVLKWLNSIESWKKELYKKIILKAIIYQKLREYGRILMVKNLNLLRNILLNISDLKEKELIYFHTISEIENLCFNKEKALERKSFYEKNNIFNFESKIKNKYLNKNKNNIWVSKWLSKGFIVTIDTINNYNSQKILYTDILSPSLTKYFSQINWIISKNWWLLSHLAIIAREKNIPVVISSKIDFNIWDIVEINWENWDIKILETNKN